MPASVAQWAEVSDWFSRTADGTTKTITGLAWSAGDVIIVVTGAENGTISSAVTPSNANLTFGAAVASAGTGATEAPVWIYQAKAESARSLQTITITHTSTANGAFGGAVWVVTGADTAANATANLNETSISRVVSAGSIVIYGLMDFTANNPPGKTPLVGSGGTTTERRDAGDGTTYAQYMYDEAIATAGTFSFGPNNYTSLQVAQVCIEVASTVNPKVVRAYPASGTLGTTNPPITFTTTIDTTGLGSKGAVLVGFSYQRPNGGNVTGASVATATLDGTPLTPIVGFTPNVGSVTAGVALYGILNPTSGASQTLIIDMTGGTGGTADKLTVNVVCLQDVNAFGNTGTYNDGTGTTGNQAVSISAAATSLVVAIGFHGDVITGVGASTTQIGAINNRSIDSAGGCGSSVSRPSTGSLMNLNFTSSLVDHWTIFAVELTDVPAAPDAPTNLLITTGDGQLGLGWTDSGTGITDHEVDWALASAPTSWLGPVATGSAAPAYVKTGLTNGTGYVFRVRAINSSGTGAWSSTSATVTPGAISPQRSPVRSSQRLA